jgi:hypothetical protein
MVKQLMLYENAVPVSYERHGRLHVEVGNQYAFSRNVNSVPLMATEFAHAALDYPIVFGETGAIGIPAAVLGLRADENLFVDAQGAWRATYIPAFIRRYPFVFSSANEGKTFTLCMDETFPGINKHGQGESLFGADGKPTQYLSNALKFLQQYQLEFERAKAFYNKLKELELLEPVQARLNLSSGRGLALSGFSIVNRDRLKKLSAEVLAKLAASDELEAMYAHLVSLGNFDRLQIRLAERSQDSGRETAPAIGQRQAAHPAE